MNSFWGNYFTFATRVLILDLASCFLACFFDRTTINHDVVTRILFDLDHGLTSINRTLCTPRHSIYLNEYCSCNSAIIKIQNVTEKHHVIIILQQEQQNMTKSSLSLSLLSSIFATVAFFLSWSSTFNCNFVQFTTDDQDTGLSLGFGLWSHSWYAISSSLNGSIVFQACIGYGSTAIDKSMMAARIFSLLALALGGTFFFANIISGCVTPNKRATSYTRSEGVAYLLTSLFQGLSLLLLNSTTVCTNNRLINQLQSEIDAREHVRIEFDDTCTISTGARCCIAAIVFWFLAGLASCQATSAARKEENNGGNNLRDPLIDSIL